MLDKRGVRNMKIEAYIYRNRGSEAVKCNPEKPWVVQFLREDSDEATVFIWAAFATKTEANMAVRKFAAEHGFKDIRVACKN